MPERGASDFKIKEFRELLRLRTQSHEFALEVIEQEKRSIEGKLSAEKENLFLQETLYEKKKMLNEAQSLYLEMLKQGKNVHTKTKDAILKEIKLLQQSVKETEKQVKASEKQTKLLEKQASLQRTIVSYLKQGYNYLMMSDKVIKGTILNLGLSAERANLVRQSFQDSAHYAVRLGGSLQDIGLMMTTFADETGRVKIFSESMVKDIMQIGKGTALGVEQATRLAGQFELMGYSTRGTMEYVEGVLETTERMGVNINAVMRRVSTDFKRLQSFTFLQGIQGFTQMASYAEKMKVDMGMALDAAETARSLENAIGLAAQLQVMGGEFAKTDPFELLFLARNDPAEFTKKINEMTKGVVSFRKMADGSFQTFISPADRDRLAQVAKTLGMSTEELTQQARRMAEIQRMRQQMLGTGLDKEQRELVEGAAKFDEKTGRFLVEIGRMKKDISDITTDDIKVLETHTKSLEERAKAAQTFEEVLKATIEELKTVLLPILKGVNEVLMGVRPIIIKLTDAFRWLTGWTEHLGVAVGTLMIAGLLWKGVVAGLKAVAIMKMTGGKGGLTETLSPARMLAKGKGAGAAAKGVGMKAMGAGVGVGAAGLGVGAGIGAAAGGISLLADSMEKLDENKAEILKSIINTLSVSTAVASIAAVAILAFGKASLVATPGLLGLGAAVLMIGGGIGAAAAGIGYMVGNMAELARESKGLPKAMLAVSAGIGAISMSAAQNAKGLAVFTNVLSNMAKNASDIDKIGDTFDSINTVLSGSKENIAEIDNLIKSLSGLKGKEIGVFADLKEMFSKPIQVEFKDKDVAVVSNITFNVDGYEFHQKTKTASYISTAFDKLKIGKGAERSR